MANPFYAANTIGGLAAGGCPTSFPPSPHPLNPVKRQTGNEQDVWNFATFVFSPCNADLFWILASK